MEPTAPPNPSSPPIVLAAEGLTQRTTDQYHALFYAMDQGFCVIELQYDDAGEHVVDFRYQQLNPAFSQQSGIPEGALGKTARELMPDLEPFWFDTYGRVALTGESVRLEHYVPQVGRWFDVHAFRVGAAETRQVGVLFTDITARKRRETNLAFLVDVTQDLVQLTSMAEMMASLSEKIGRYFRVPRVHLAAIDEAAQTAVVTNQWHVDGLADFDDQPTHRLADYVTDAFQRTAHADETIVVRVSRTTIVSSAPLLTRRTAAPGRSWPRRSCAAGSGWRCSASPTPPRATGPSAMWTCCASSPPAFGPGWSASAPKRRWPPRKRSTAPCSKPCAKRLSK